MFFLGCEHVHQFLSRGIALKNLSYWDYCSSRSKWMYSGNAAATLLWECSRLLIRAHSLAQRPWKCQLHVPRSGVWWKWSCFWQDGLSFYSFAYLFGYSFLNVVTPNWPWRHSYTALHEELCVLPHLFVVCQSWPVGRGRTVKKSVISIKSSFSL